MWKRIAHYYFKLGGVCAIGLLASCLKRPPSLLIKDTRKDEIYALWQAKMEVKPRMSAYVKARFLGIKRFAGTSSIDILVQRSSDIYLSVRSFFEIPLQVLVCNESVCCLQDNQQTDNIKPYCSQASKPLEGFPFLPRYLVNILLGPVFSSPPDQLEEGSGKDSYILSWQNEPDNYQKIEIDLKKNELKKYWVKDRDKKIAFEVKYKSYVEQGAVKQASQIDISGNNEGSQFDLRMFLKEWEFPSQPFPSENFVFRSQ